MNHVIAMRGENISTNVINGRVGARIRRKREQAGMTQTALADVTGIGRTSITNMELGGQAIMVHQLVGVARALNADVHEFLDDIDREDAPTNTPSRPPIEMAGLLTQLGKAERGSRR